MNEQTLLQSVSILESRLQFFSTEEKEGASFDRESIERVFPASAKCLYYSLLGNNYLDLYELHTNIIQKEEVERSNEEVKGILKKSLKEEKRKSNHYGMKCLETLEIGMKLVSDTFDPHESLRLVMTYTYCKALCLIEGKYLLAKAIAEKVFFLANDYNTEISEESAKALQRLRDDFMSYEKPKPSRKERKPVTLIPGKILTLEQASAYQRTPEDDEKDGILDDDSATKEQIKSMESSFFGRRRSSKVKQIDKIKKLRQFRLLDENEGDGMKSPHSPYGEHHNNKKYRLAIQIRRQISLPVPIIIEAMPSSPNVLKALDRIFRAYVRGNALPGQQSGGSTVDLAGNTLSFRLFVLQGPYLSWKGFLSFLLDFSVASLPDYSSRDGKNFYRSLNHQMAKDLKDQYDGANDPTSSPTKSDYGGVDAIVSMLEAAMIFIESARSATPILVMKKYMKFHAELAESFDSDPWNNVYDWTIQDRSDGISNQWDIAYGINFIQFVDCLAKLAIIAYTSAVFNEMLPTNQEKIEHFFTAFLGLNDERKWFPKVDNKLKKMKSLIMDIRSQTKPN